MLNKKQHFEDRYDAGKKLAGALLDYKDENPYVLALPRGGVPLGYEVAKELDAPLNVIISRKIGAPDSPEFGIGAVSENGVFYLDMETIKAIGAKKEDIEEIIAAEQDELTRRIDKYRDGKTLPILEGRTVILIDDGLATGVTAHASIQAVDKLSPQKIVFAAPVCAYDTARSIEKMVDEFECLYSPHDLRAIGLYYHKFDQITDKKVIELLNKSSN